MTSGYSSQNCIEAGVFLLMQLSQAHRPWAVKMTGSRGKVFWWLFPSQQHLAFFHISTKETKLLTFPGRLDFPEPWGFGPV